MDIYKLFRTIPGGMLLVPMFLVAILNTVFPNALSSSGSMTMALFKTGTLTFAGFILFATGAGIDIKTLGPSLKRSGVLAVAKLALSFGFGYAFIYLFGLDGIWGINALAFVSCISSCNPGVYMGLIQDYGEPADLSNFPILNILTMPAIPILIIASASGAGFDIMEIVTVLIPFVLGMILGNLDKKFSKMFMAVTPLALPFIGCCFGASINLVTAAKAGVAGIILSLIYMAIHLLILLPADRGISKQPGYAAMAMSSVAGIALAVPLMLGPTFAGYQDEAIAQIALCLIITNILSPLMTKVVVGKWGAPRTLKELADREPGIPPAPARQRLQNNHS